MSLLRCIDQNHQSLKEHFEGFRHATAALPSKALDMLKLIDKLNVVLGEVALYTYTSHDALCLVNTKETTTPGAVTIWSLGYGLGYEVRYKMPSQSAPWEDAWVVGIAEDVVICIKMIFTAIDRSDAWQGNDAVQTLINHQ